VGTEIESKVNLQRLKRVGAGDPVKYRVSHLLVRLIAFANIAHLLLTFQPSYFRAKINLFNGIDIYWMLASSFLLPLYVGFETWWMFRAKPSQKRSLLIDWLVAVLWFAIWWAVALHSLFLHYPMF
jgi:hypothetical protein